MALFAKFRSPDESKTTLSFDMIATRDITSDRGIMAMLAVKSSHSMKAATSIISCDELQPEITQTRMQWSFQKVLQFLKHQPLRLWLPCCSHSSP